jgi:Asp-tRNA(Asn)/Glu-tRNA(Gln) amidotransferase A subunit family amidase
MQFGSRTGCRWVTLLAVLMVTGATGVAAQDNEKVPAVFSLEDIAASEKLFDLNFTTAERESLFAELTDHLEANQTLHTRSIGNSVPPSLVFNPLPVGFTPQTQEHALRLAPPQPLEVSENADAAALEKLAYASVRDLGELVRTRRITSLQLTQMYLERLKKHGPQLEAVISLTEELALEQARRADSEIAAGNYRGPLHGIPYAAKDLLAVPGYKTTWGAAPFKDQVLDETATVVRKLTEAGAVLVAKTTLGALAWGDVWFGGKTRNPWNVEQGSSGSSAGSASCTSAGLVAFSIGTETLGSIVSPATRCGVTGLRPTFGRVSRAGAMALSWSMDKIGPICRTVEDCALVLDAIRGSDGLDPSVIDANFAYDATVDWQTLRIGYLKSAFDSDYPNAATDAATLDKLRELGAQLVEFELPQYPLGAMVLTLSVEAAAAFDELTRSNADDELVRQIRNAWPNVFRAARYVPAVEYLQANRLRTQLIQDMHEAMQAVDVYLSPAFGGGNLLLTNLTGHPCVVLPNGFKEDGSPVSITFMGGLFDEAAVLAVAKAYQDATDFHTRQPPLFAVGK